MELSEYIQIYNICEEWEGQALWQILANRDIFYKGEEVQTGSFRWNGGVIAEFCGGCYMDYYCSSLDNRVVDKLWKRLKKHTKIFNMEHNCALYWSKPSLGRFFNRIRRKWYTLTYKPSWIE